MESVSAGFVSGADVEGAEAVWEPFAVWTQQ